MGVLMADPTLIDLIELHERKWGERRYAGRPALSDLMSLPIVAVWRSGKRFMLSAHRAADDLNAIIFAIVTGKDANPQDRRLAMVYFEKRLIPFTVKIVSLSEQQKVSAEQSKPAEPVQDKFIFQRRINTGGIPAAPAPRTTPVVTSIKPMPTGTPAFLEPEPLVPDDPNAKPGRNTGAIAGRQVEWLPGREVRIFKTKDTLLQELKPPIKQTRIYRGEQR